MSTPADFQLDDARLAAAYEATSPQIRATVKTTLALLRALWPPSPLRRESLDLPAAGALGCSLARQTRPCGFVLAVLSPHFAAPTRLAAQIMAARLAGVDRVVVARPLLPGAPPFPPALLTCLELVGVEQILELPGHSEQPLIDLLRALCAPSCDQEALSAGRDEESGAEDSARTGSTDAGNSGRVLFFGTNSDDDAFATLCAPLCTQAQALGMATHQQDSPRLVVDLPPALREVVHAVHPDATFLPLAASTSSSTSTASSSVSPSVGCASSASFDPSASPDSAGPMRADALLALPEQLALLPAEHSRTRLRLGGDFAPCWVPPLPPAFFQDHQMTLVPFTVEFPS